MFKILAINPGSTSTKIGIFNGREICSTKTIRYSKKELNYFRKIIDQIDHRMQSIDNFIKENNINLSKVDIFIGRGGYLKPLRSGLYKVNKKMINDLVKAKYGEHASNLGAIIAYNYAKKYNKEAFILDPVCVDELNQIAKISGHPLFERKSIFHALNHKRVARAASKELGKDYEKLNLIVCHLGGGITIGLHNHGRVVDVNNAIDGEGPFTPERSGGLQIGSFLRYVFENNLNYDESFKMICGNGGLVAYFGTTNFSELMQKYENGNDKKLNVIIEAMAYQISKNIVAMAAPVCGKIDGIILTGGLAHSESFINLIISKIKFITKNIFIYPGEDELMAMVEGVLLGKSEKIEIMEYK